jgi:hypothetical protein
MTAPVASFLRCEERVWPSACLQLRGRTQAVDMTQVANIEAPFVDASRERMALAQAERRE